MRPLLKAVLVLASAGALLSAQAAKPPPKAEPPGDPAPAFRLADIAGRVVSLSDYKGKVVLLNFWATWCDSCREEMPMLEKVYRKHRKEGFAVLAPSIDEKGRKAVIPFIADMNLSFPVLLADLKTARTYEVFGLPTSFLIDPQGRIARKYVGQIDPKALENDILAQFRRKS